MPVENYNIFLKNSTTTITYEMLVKMSHEEFNRLVLDNCTNPRETLAVITQFEVVLEQIKKKDGEQHERTKFYTRVLRLMYAAMQAEEEINFWKNVATRAKMEAAFYTENATIYYNELMKYKTIQDAINTGTLDSYIDEVKKRNQTI